MELKTVRIGNNLRFVLNSGYFHNLYYYLGTKATFHYMGEDTSTTMCGRVFLRAAIIDYDPGVGYPCKACDAIYKRSAAAEGLDAIEIKREYIEMFRKARDTLKEQLKSHMVKYAKFTSDDDFQSEDGELN